MTLQRSIVFVALVGSPLACASTSHPFVGAKAAEDWSSLSLYERDYEGSQISVCGTLRYEFESQVICVPEQTAQAQSTSTCLWLEMGDHPDDNVLQNLSGKLVLASGRIAFHPTGSRSAMEGELELAGTSSVHEVSACPEGVSHARRQNAARDHAGMIEVAAAEVAAPSTWVDAALVTNRELKRCIRAGRCEFALRFEQQELFVNCQSGTARDDEAVECVTWKNAYCEFVGKRVPTEFEWLSASRDARFVASERHEEWTSSPFCDQGIGADCTSFSKVVRTGARGAEERRDGLVGLRQYQHDEHLSVRCAE